MRVGPRLIAGRKEVTIAPSRYGKNIFISNAWVPSKVTLEGPITTTHIKPAQANDGCARVFGPAIWRAARMSLN
jgi:hypothetical protein